MGSRYIQERCDFIQPSSVSCTHISFCSRSLARLMMFLMYGEDFMKIRLLLMSSSCCVISSMDCSTKVFL